MPEDKDIQQSVVSVQSQASGENVAAIGEWDICQAVDEGIAEKAAEELRHLSTSNPALPQGSEPYFPFRPLEKVSAAETVVNAWITVWPLPYCGKSFSY